jgi:hypothetical protein
MYVVLGSPTVSPPHLPASCLVCGDAAMSTPEAIRKFSLETAKRLGFSVSESLPLLDPIDRSRSQVEIINRLLAMNCVAACAYGFDRNRALQWAMRESANESLTPKELRFLRGDPCDKTQFMLQIEGMWALGWCLNHVSELDFSAECSSSFVQILPDLKHDQASTAFRKSSSLRPLDAIVAQCDLAYCLHSGLVDRGLTAKLKLGIQPFAIIERRRALEWAISDDPWDELSLDT